MNRPTTSWPCCFSSQRGDRGIDAARHADDDALRAGARSWRECAASGRCGVVESGVGSRFFQYAALDAIATAVHYAILVGLVEAGALAPQRAAALGAWVGAQVAYAGNAAFTFEDAGASTGGWLRFQVTAVVGAVLSFALVALGVPRRPALPARAGRRDLHQPRRHLRDQSALELRVDHRRRDGDAGVREFGGEVGAGKVGRFAQARSGDRIGASPRRSQGWQNSSAPSAGTSASQRCIRRR